VVKTITVLLQRDSVAAAALRFSRDCLFQWHTLRLVVVTSKVPDLPGCVTEGSNLSDALEMANDAISMWLCDAEDNKENIPAASNIFNLKCEKSEFISLIIIDTIEYRNLRDSRAVKKR
jgi:predicted RNase H-like HicB family nuclease